MIEKNHIFFVIILLLTIQCGGDNGNPTPVDEITAEGWSLFSVGDYDAAIGRFSEALGLNADWADAYNGRGWSNLELRRLDGAKTDLNTAVQIATGQNLSQVANEARTGLGSVLNREEEYDETVQVLGSVVTSNPSFQFTHRSSVNIFDVRLILSSAFLSLSEGEEDAGTVDSYFDQIAEHLNAIDPDNPVRRDDPFSWRVGVETFGSFEEAILEKLEWLINLYIG